MMKMIGAVALLTATSAVQALPFTVSLESEAPGLQNSTSSFTQKGVENFDSRPTGDGRTFTTSFGGSVFRGTYTGVRINNADQYGGAGGAGRYAVTFSDTGYALDLSSTVPGGVTYFGFWLSALDRGNMVTFESRGKTLFTFSAQEARTFINQLSDSRKYYGNPNAAFLGRNSAEPYAFLNFYAKSGTTFDRIVFAESPRAGGYESDNHTVGTWSRKSGTIIPNAGVSAVPEPATWAMLIVGFGLIGAAIRRRRFGMARVTD